MDERIQRSLYDYFKKNGIKNFVGVNEIYQEGNSVDLVLNTYKHSISKNINKIVKYLKLKKYVYKK